MRIHFSWTALLAAAIFVIALGLLVRTAALRLIPGEPSTVTNPTPALAASPTPVAAVAAPAQTASAAPTATALTTPTEQPSATASATVAPTATATASATPAPTLPPPSPTPFQPPTREPTPVPTPLAIIAQGFGQSTGRASYAFVVNNPNPSLLAQNVRYQVALYDAAGVVLATDIDDIAMVGPGQQMGAAKELPLATNLVVTRIEVLLRPAQFVQSPPLQMLPVANAAFVPGNPPNMTGILTNLLSRDLAELEVIGIAYDDFGIIGGGSTSLPFAPAGGRVPVSIPIITSLEATRVEFFASVNATP